MRARADSWFLAQLLDRAQSCRDTTEFRLQVLEDLRRHIGCDGGVFRLGAHWRGSVAVYLDPGRRYMDAYLEGEDRYRPELSRWISLSRGGRALIDNEVYPVSEQRRMAVYGEMMRGEGIRSMLHCPLLFRGETIGLINFVRRGAGSSFRAETAEELTPILPMVALAERALASALAVPTAAVAERTPDSFSAAFATLARRERQIALLIAQGLQSKEIANLLGISFHNVRKQTLRIFDKLAVRGRTQVALAIDHAGFLNAHPASPEK